jgi:DNA mismatch repair protein MutL
MIINQIHRLDEETIRKIAAGEVVERPASVVKELVENSIDAGATRIEIEIKNGGRHLISVSDNGSGMEREDVVLAIERHTTSKILQSDDLWNLTTLGFRGEALSAIAAVSQMEVFTKTRSGQAGTYVEVKAGLLQKVNDIGIPDGTTVKVRDLFYNTPARLKYLKSIPTEAGYISEILLRLALGYPEISFRLQHHEYEVLFTPGNGDMLETIVAVFGKEISKELIPVNYQDQDHELFIKGLVGKPSITKTNHNYENFFVNRRYFRNRSLNAAVEKAYHTLLPIARYPFAIIFIEINPSLVDINAHPSKMEVRFSNETDLFRAVYHGINQTLKSNNLMPEWTISREEEVGVPSFPTPPVPTVAPVNLEINYRETIEIQELHDAGNLNVGEPLAADFYHPGIVPQTEHSSGENFYVFPKTISNTYIIVEDEKGILFIDQHAAHERILFERFFNDSKRFLGSQGLLLPETVNLTYPQYKVVSERLLLFKDIGFELEAFGGQTLIIRAIPITLMNLDYRQIVQDLIEQFLHFETFKDPAEIKEAFIITMACRTAVKAGDRLKPIELENLVKDLLKSENPYTCPHGRPTIFRLGTEELARKFLRR